MDIMTSKAISQEGRSVSAQAATARTDHEAEIRAAAKWHPWFPNRRKEKAVKLGLVFLLGAALTACGDVGSSSSGADSTSSTGAAIQAGVVNSAPASVCPDGGITITAQGTSSYVCKAASENTKNLTTLVSIVNEPAGTNCANGGIAISVGLDSDKNGILDTTEITSTNYVCNGANGTNGTNGLNTLMSIVPEPAGAICAAGGLNITSGLDSNGNNVLDPGEVTATNYACNGTNGTNGLTTLMGMVAEPAGANCANGGQQLTSGMDANNNGILETGEVTSTQYVCNGVNGTSGTNGLTTLLSLVTEPPGGNCAYGGQRIAAGLDANHNGILDTSEIASTNYVCNGAPGSGAGINWVNVTTDSVQAVANTGYLADSPSQVAITLPPAPAMGDIVRVTGVGTGGWKIAQNENQTIATQGFDDIGTIGALWTPRDSAKNWGGVASSADGTKLVATVLGGQIYMSADSGVTWTPRDAARAWQSVASSADGTKLVAVAYNDQIYTSADSGVTWTPRDSVRSWRDVASSADGSKLVAVVNGGQIYTSMDSGATWTPRDSARNWTSVASSSNGTKLVATDSVDIGYSYIYTSTDSGVTWTPRLYGHWISVASSSDGTKLVAATSTYSVAGINSWGRIYTSTDSGATWITRDLAANWYGVASSADGTRLVAIEHLGQIYTSTDSGATWTPRDSARNWHSVASSADGTRLVAVVSGGQIYTSEPTLVQSTTVGTAGWISGGQYDAIELQYIGNNTFNVLSHEGNLVGQ